MAYLTLEMRTDYAKCVVVGRSEGATYTRGFTVSILDTSLKITNSSLQPHLPAADELTNLGYLNETYQQIYLQM